jgi:hypothetical protein
MKKTTKHGTYGCPAQDCSSGDARRQKDLTDTQKTSLPTEIQRKIENIVCKRCNYCGCVYIRNYDFQPQCSILGFLDGGVSGAGWKPLHQLGIQ